MRKRLTRRDALRAGAAGLVAGLAGCGSMQGGNELESQLSTVESATAEFEEPTAALEAGFQVAGPVAPGQGWHFINEERVQAAAESGVSIEEPQVLTYDTSMNLVAVEWAVPDAAVEEPPSLFADSGTEMSEEWHAHDSFTHVFADGSGQADNPTDIGFDTLTTNDNWSAFRPPDTNLSPGDEIALRWGVESPDANNGEEARIVDLAATHPRLQTLHVWIHEENPEGVFHPTHPDVANGEAHDHEH